MKSKKLILVFIILFQLVFLGGMAALHGTRIWTADKILLETEPVDPFSVFRGRYLILNYKISVIPSNLLVDCDARKLKFGNYVYVVLDKKDNFWEPVSAYRAKPGDIKLVYLRGEVVYSTEHEVRLEYNMKSFFLSEKSADEIESKRRMFLGDSWREIGKIKKENIANLSEEDRRIYKSGITEYWCKGLKTELDCWLREGIVDQEQVAEIKGKYTKSLERIKVASRGGPAAAGRHVPLSVRVAVTKDGIGYPIQLFWEGKEYR